MKRFKPRGWGVILRCLCLSLLSGCAANGPSTLPQSAQSGGTEQAAQSVKQEQVVRTPLQSDESCRYERATGSHIATRKCYSAAEREAMAKGSEEWMRTGGRRGSPAVVRDAADPREEETPR